MQLHVVGSNVPLLRRDPWRIFFPAGTLAAWVGVLPWLLLALGATEEYRSIQHAMTQVQAFLACFVAGFLFTFVPRRTGAPAPAYWELAGSLLCAVGLTAAVWVERWAFSQVFWLAWIALVSRFVVAGAANVQDRSILPASLVWIPVALAAAALGAVLTAAGAAQGVGGMWIHDIGRAMVLEGVTTGFVLGVGSFLLPVLLQGRPPAPASRGLRAFHAIAALAFFASFLLGAWSLRAGFGARAAISTVVLLSAGLHHRAAVRAAVPAIARVAVWCVPLGFWLAAIFPAWRKAALHVGFIGGFGLLAFAISAHVAGAHAGRLARPRNVITMAVLMLLAIPARALVDLDPKRFTLWLGVGAALFLSGTLIWIAALAPALVWPARRATAPRDASAVR